MIKRKLGDISIDLETQIMTLDIDDVERLGEVLLEFSSVHDLIQWLNTLDD